LTRGWGNAPPKRITGKTGIARKKRRKTQRCQQSDLGRKTRVKVQCWGVSGQYGGFPAAKGFGRGDPPQNPALGEKPEDNERGGKGSAQKDQLGMVRDHWGPRGILNLETDEGCWWNWRRREGVGKGWLEKNHSVH